MRDVLVEMLRSVVGHARVLPELTRHRRYSAVIRPDIIVTDFYGFRRHLIIDIKTLDCSTRTHALGDHASDRGLAGHVEAERALPAYYTDGGRSPRAIGDSTLVCAAIGRFGGIGEQLSQLVTDLAVRRAGGLTREERREEQARGFAFAGYWRHRLSLAAQVCIARAIRATRTEREDEPFEEEDRESLADSDATQTGHGGYHGDSDASQPESLADSDASYHGGYHG